MSFSLGLQPDMSDAQIYSDLIPQVESLLDASESAITNLANLSALLKEAFPKISWVGFYLVKDDKLVLGPFQGKVACTSISMGKGVCGAAALKRETIIVPDVHHFPGHIACDGGSNSEIVLPLIKNNKLVGVLDLDSYQYNAFSPVDKKHLEKMLHFLCSEILTSDIIPL